MSINRVTVSGNLTRDPELRRTQSGMEILGFGMAVNDRRKDPQSGEWRDFPNYIDVTVFGARGSSLAGILKKGMKVFVDGKLRWSQWEQNGQKRSKIEIVADDVELPPKGSQGQSNGGYQPSQGNYAPQQQTAPQNAPQGYVMPQQASQGVYDEDIPF